MSEPKVEDVELRRLIAGVKMTLDVAHGLRRTLDRFPSLMEIKWRVVQALQDRFAMRRAQADVYADRMIEIVQVALKARREE